MAYVIVSTTDRELNRFELRKTPVIVGRAPDCDISVHDILLSRRHCRITPTTDGWLVIDLGSKNGTSVEGRKIEQRRLKDGDVIVIGKTRVTFCAAEFMPAPRTTHRPATPIPVDPGETAAGTVFAMEFIEPAAEASEGRKLSVPSPKPRPRDPDSFESDDVYSMLEQIASSSWDSIYAVNAQPLRRDRPLPRPRVASKNNARSALPRASSAGPRISLALQATVPQRPPSFAPPPPTTLRPNQSAASLLQKRLSRLTRWVGQIGHLRLF